MRSPHTTGEEEPGGTATFHNSFLPGPNTVGGCAVSETPEQFGPRNCDQDESAAKVIVQAASRRAAERMKAFMARAIYRGLPFAQVTAG